MTRLVRRLAIAAILTALAGCTAPAPSAAPSSASGPVGLTVVACPLTLGDGTVVRPGPVPLAPGLPAGLVPPGSWVFALVFPGAGSDPVFTVAPAGSTCAVAVGTGFVLTLADPGGDTVLIFETGGGVGPAACRASHYLEASRKACEAEGGSTFAPGAASPAPDETVIEIDGGRPGRSLAVVLADLGTGMAAARLYGFETTEAGSSWEASCAVHSLGRAACAAALAFISAGPASVTDAIVAAVEGS